jgi:copper(I)-binding protein
MNIRRCVWALVAVLGLALAACGTPAVSTGAQSNNGNITLQTAWARPVTISDDTATVEATAATEHSMHGDHAATTATGTAMDSMAAGGGVTSAAYMVIVNTGSAPDQLLNVTTEAAGVAELHHVLMENNVAQMRPVQAVEVPAGGQIELKPGGYHVMLADVKRTLRPSDVVPLTLTFQNAGEVQVNAEVREP